MTTKRHPSRRTLSLLCLGLGLMAACGEPESEFGKLLPDQLMVPPAPANGFQMVLPPIKNIPAGANVEYCTWTDRIVDKDTFVEAMEGFQAGPGHHVIIYATSEHKPAGTTRECMDSDMASFRYVAAALGEGTSGLNRPPEGLAFLLPKGFQLVVNQHFLNASAKARDGQSGFNVVYADPAKQYTLSSGFTILRTDLEVPVAKSDVEIACVVKQDFTAWLMFPHMHEWGTHFKATRKRNGKTDTLFDVDWGEGFIFHPPETYGKLNEPPILQKGDEIRITCSFNNTTGEKMYFGKEMCVISSQYADYKKNGNIFCDNGTYGSF